MSQMKWGGRVVAGAMVLAAILARPEAASAQLDPLLMIKKGTPATPVKPNVIFAIDTSARMQYDADGAYYDPNDYVRGGFLTAVGVEHRCRRHRHERFIAASTSNLAHANGGSDKFNADTIETVGDDQASAYANFYSKTRFARRARGACESADRQHERRPLRPRSRCARTPHRGERRRISIRCTWRSESAAQRARRHRQVGDHQADGQRAKNGSITAVQTPIVLTDAANCEHQRACDVESGRQRRRG